LPADAVLAFNVRVFGPDGDCATDRIGAGFRKSERRAVQQASHRVDLHQRSGTYVGAIGLFGWRQSRLRKPSWVMMGDERIRTLGGAWQHAIGNVIAGPARYPTG
jgi:hypothetical protein